MRERFCFAKLQISLEILPSIFRQSCNRKDAAVSFYVPFDPVSEAAGFSEK